MKVTFLGPLGTTFSHQAYEQFRKSFTDLPEVTEENYVQSPENNQTLELVMSHGGYGVIPVETLARGGIWASINPFIKLLGNYDSKRQPPFDVLGSVSVLIKLCVMARRGPGELKLDDIKCVYAHPEALAVCSRNLAELKGCPRIVPMESNGLAAQQVSISHRSECAVAIGPISAAGKFSLTTIVHGFEDDPALTTFVLVGPHKDPKMIGRSNRMMFAFRLKNQPGSLATVLSVFVELEINICQMHSMYVDEGCHHFFVEIEMSLHQRPRSSLIKDKLEGCTEKYLAFGPYEIRYW